MQRGAIRGGYLAVMLALGGGLAGCETLAITALGVGASAGVSHAVENVSYRTFTASSKTVRRASLIALGRMGMTVESTEPAGKGDEIIRASCSDRDVEIQIEALSSKATRMRAVARNGLFSYDGATAREVVVQTAKAMGRS